MMAEIVLDRVYKRYGKGRGPWAVQDLSLRIRDREFLVLLGPSGCGKTSTLRMIAGLEEITQGTLSFDGRRVNDLTPQQRDVAMAFESYALYPTLTVRGNIAFPLTIRRWPRARIDEKVAWAADAVQIADLLGRKPFELSGGQQQRVSLARAIVREPQVFLFDEPLSHLDMKQRQVMRAEIKRLHATLQRTMIYVTHDQKEAMALADRIAVMHEARLQQVGTPAEILNDPANAFVAGFVGEPAMNFLDVELRQEDNGTAWVSYAGCRLADLPGPRYGSFGGCGCDARDVERGTSDVTSRATVPRGTIASTGRGPRATVPALRIGIRPHHVQLAETRTGDAALAARVVAYESLGERGILTVRIQTQDLTILTPPDRAFHKAQSVWLRCPAEHLYFFSRDTGERLRMDRPHQEAAGPRLTAP